MRAKLAAALAAALLASALAADDPLAPALDALKAGSYEKAAELASAVKVDDPARGKAMYVAGEAYLALEKWFNAEDAFREVLEAKPDSLPALVGMGRAQIGTGNADAAITTLEKAVKLDAKDAPARRTLGEARVAKGDSDKGLSDLYAATKLDPKDPLTGRAVVETLLKMQKPEDALDAATKLAKAAPDHPMGHFLSGLVLDRLDRDKDAIEAYEKAIAKDDHFLDAHKNLAILCTVKNAQYEDKERTKKALDHYARYFELGGKDEELKKLYESIKAFLGSQKGK